MAQKPDLKLGALFSILTAFLLATQSPLSFSATKSISVPAYIGVTEIVQIVCLPLMLRTSQARRDFRSLLSPRHAGKFLALLLLGLTSLLLFVFGLGRGNPIIIAAVLNLDPFWAALVAFLIVGQRIPTSIWTFGICMAVAFFGALLIAISQSEAGAHFGLGDVAGAGIAMPVPILTALSGTLIGKWFSKYDNAATLAVTFLTAGVLLIPISFVVIYARSGFHEFGSAIPAMALLAVGTVLAVVIGRVMYQRSLTITDNNNGYVSMFFLLIPAFTCMMSLALSPWLPDLKFKSGPLFYAGLLMVAVALLAFSWGSLRSGKGGTEKESRPILPRPRVCWGPRAVRSNGRHARTCSGHARRDVMPPAQTALAASKWWACDDRPGHLHPT